MFKRPAPLITILTVLITLLFSTTLASAWLPKHSTPTAIQVTTLADSGAGSLRQAINTATSNHIIYFSVSGTIILESTLVISGKHVVIDGEGQTITISGNHRVTIFGVDSDAALTLNAMTIADGDASRYGDGGGIHNSGLLNVSNTTFSNNFGHDNGSGGAIANLPGSMANISNSAFSGNSAGQGGAIFNAEGILNVSNTVFAGNFTTTNDGTGGAILNRGGTTNVSVSTFYDNSAQVSGSNLANEVGISGTMNVKSTAIINSSTNSCNTPLTTSISNAIDDESCGSTAR